MTCDVFVVVHLARTCDDRGVYVTKDSSEIIEIGWILMETTSLKEISRASALVRPMNTPITTACTNSTGLNWDHLQSGLTLEGGISLLHQNLQEHVISKGLKFAFVLFNSFDLKVELIREARDKVLTLPGYLQHPRLFDIRSEYSKWQQYHPESLSYISSSLSSICVALDVVETSAFYSTPRVPSKGPRRALEEAELLARITKSLIDKRLLGDQVFQRPIDVATDMGAFLTEKSKVLYLTNLPQDATQSELESWFTQYGGRPIAFWTLKTPDQFKSTQTGFAVFGTHQEAADCLVMNGRALNDRAIEVSPSSGVVLERAQDILSSFPTSKNRPRPGDWTCASCGFSNFQRRTACFRCNFPQPVGQGQPVSQVAQPHHHFQYQQQGMADAATNYHMAKNSNTSSGNNNSAAIYNAGNGHNHIKSNNLSSVAVPFRAGDWKCGNEGCNYHNFAKNINCLKCGASRVGAAVFGGDQYHARYNHSNGNSGYRRVDPNAYVMYGHQAYTGQNIPAGIQQLRPAGHAGNAGHSDVPNLHVV